MTEAKKTPDRIYELIGIREFTRIDDSDSCGSLETRHYIVYLRDGKQRCCIKAGTIYHDCVSGYCGASTGYLTEAKFDKEEKIGTLHYIPKNKPLKVHVVDISQDEKVLRAITDAKETPKAAPPEEDESNILFCQHTGADRWYPSGKCVLHTKWLQRTNRLLANSSSVYPSAQNTVLEDDNKTPRRQLYVFTGPSLSGKSFLGSHLKELRVYETDAAKELPKDIKDYHVVVLGNKYTKQTEQLKALLVPLKPSVQVVWVSFWPWQVSSSSSSSSYKAACSSLLPTYKKEESLRQILGI